MSNILNRKKYEGRTHKVVLAFDIGTTFSGISYRCATASERASPLIHRSVLYPDQIPDIGSVTRYLLSPKVRFSVLIPRSFPGDQRTAGTARVPTLIYYDQTGKVRAVGAEAMREGIHEQAEEEQWIKSEWCAYMQQKWAPL